MHSHCKKRKAPNTLHIYLYNKRSNKFFNQVPLFQTLFAICSPIFAQVNSVFKSDRPFVTINAQGISSSWLYDTGASITLMSIVEFRKICPENQPPKTPVMVNLTSASDQQLKTVGLYNLKLTIGSPSIIYPVYVTENKTPAILGIDAIKAFGLLYSPLKHCFTFKKENVFSSPVHAVSQNSPNASSKLDSLSTLTPLTLNKNILLPPLTSLSLSVSTLTDSGYRPPPGVLRLAHVGTTALPYLNRGPRLVTTDRLGENTPRINNCAPTELNLLKVSVIGFFENINSQEIQQIDDKRFNLVKNEFPRPFSVADQKEFLQKLKLTVLPSELPAYLDLILKNHDVFSKNKNYLGCATNATHKIHLKNEAPIYVKQFPIPETYHKQLNLQVQEWLRIAVIKPTNSPYNSPFFVVPKKDGSPSYVLDFGKLNANSHSDIYSMKLVEECIGDIGRSGSTIF